jgi:hypothetical protein
MAPTKFADFNKTVADLFKDDFGFGAFKVSVKSKNADSSMKVDTSRKFEDGSVASSLEVKTKCPFTGADIKNTWDTKNQVATEVALANKPLAGHKFTLNNCFSTAGACSGLKLKHEFSNDKFHLEHVFDGSDLSASAAFAHGNITAGASVTANLKSHALAKHAVAATLSSGGMKFFGALNNGNEVAGSIHHKVSCCELEHAVDFKWNLQGGNTAFNFVSKYQVDKHAFVKTSFDKDFVVGFGYTRKVTPSTSFTLSAKVDTANLAADRHQLGASVTFDF